MTDTLRFEFFFYLLEILLNSVTFLTNCNIFCFFVFFISIVLFDILLNSSTLNVLRHMFVFYNVLWPYKYFLTSGLVII